MIQTREIKRQELDALCELYNELMDGYTNFDNMKRVYSSIEENPQYILLGAFQDKELLGSLMGIVCYDLVGDCKPFLVIENVVVSSRTRRQGVGKKLMQRIEELAKERGCWYMILVSGEKRKEAHRFYEALGFKEEQVEGYRKYVK